MQASNGGITTRAEWSKTLFSPLGISLGTTNCHELDLTKPDAKEGGGEAPQNGTKMGGDKPTFDRKAAIRAEIERLQNELTTLDDTVDEISTCHTQSIDGESVHVVVDGLQNSVHSGVDMNRLRAAAQAKIEEAEDTKKLDFDGEVREDETDDANEKEVCANDDGDFESAHEDLSEQSQSQIEGLQDVLHDQANVAAEVDETNTTAYHLEAVAGGNKEYANIKHAAIGWEKPTWAENGVQLKSTDQGCTVKNGGCVAKLITMIGETGEYTWEKPEWVSKQVKLEDDPLPRQADKPVGWEKPNWATSRNLRATGKGDIIALKGDLQAPITHVRKHNNDDINYTASPSKLRPTLQGQAVRHGQNLARPITHIAKDPMGDFNFVANPEFVLQHSEVGRALKQDGANLAKPITFPEKHEGRDANFDANPALLRPTEKGSFVRQGQEIARPITFINGEPIEDNVNTA